MHTTKQQIGAKCLLATLLFSLSAFALVELKTGQSAPDFELKDGSGKVHSLKSYQGKTVVLEWLNHGCPFVRKFYGAKKMQALQEQYTQKGVVWLSIVSSAKGKEGYSTPQGVLQQQKEKGSHATAVLIDEMGTVGKKYGAKTTPHMFLIDPKGKLVYQGAMDDQPSTDPKSLEGATNYLTLALDATLKGDKVATANTTPYGCSVKYAN